MSELIKLLALKSTLESHVDETDKNSKLIGIIFIKLPCFSTAQHFKFYAA